MKLHRYFPLIVVLTVPLVIYAYSGGPPDGRTGAPDEETCNAAGCHNTFELNDGDGSLGFTGFPESYQSGESYTIELTIQDPGQSRWGFEMVALDAEGDQAGEMTIIQSDSTQKSTDTGTGRTYVKHTSTGTHQGISDGPVNWRIQWTAPDTGTGEITFYAAGNAANNNGQPTGDYIYTQSRSVTPEPTSAEIAGWWGVPEKTGLAPAYPNPFNPATTIRFRLAEPGPVELIVTDISGRLITTLTSSDLSTGAYTYRWDGTNQKGEQVPSGVYLYHLRTAGETLTKKVTLLR